jgi:hypothetical protein
MDAITISNYETCHAGLRDKFAEFAQRKSNFQIEKFVACSDSVIPSHQYRHVLTQIRVALTELKRRIIDKERQDRKRVRALEQKYEDYDLDVASSETEIESLTYDIDSKLIEINQYTAILNHLEQEHGRAFTNDDYQADEPEYWRARFARQLHDSVVDRQLGCGQGNLVAMREATCPTILPDSPNIIEILPMDMQELDAISRSSGKKLLMGEH